MKKQELDKALTFHGPKKKREIATDENLSLAALENQLRSKWSERDDYTMTADKLKRKLPGMAVASSQLDDFDYARFREEDEEILRAEQDAFTDRS